MPAMFRCPSCNEVVTVDFAQCKYCSLPFDRHLVESEVAKFKHVSHAVSEANAIQSFNAALILVGLLCLYILLSATALRRAYIHILPYGGLIWVISWFIRFRRLESKDPDLAPAGAAMNRSLLMWSIGILVYSGCIVWALMMFSHRYTR
jgi:hypothetical protein